MAQNLTDVQRAAIALVKQEKSQWEEAEAFVTDKVAFQMRNLIRACRKNYYGIFDKPIDPQTGRKKVWIPLTESLVEAVVKNIDLDQKDIHFRSKNDSGVPTTQLIRGIVKDYLSRKYFGETLDESERNLSIDGTIVWKTWKGKENGKVVVKRSTVDLLNFYIDPTADNIQDTGAVIERSLMTPEEVKAMDGWVNTDDVKGETGLSKNDNRISNMANTGETKMVEVFERWGKMPKYLLTGKRKDKESGEQVEGVIVVSNVDNNPALHSIRESKDEFRPYEECRYSKVPGRWYGRGIAEKVLMLQLWINTIVNIRINRSYVSQLGLFKIRKGSGITPQMMSRLGSMGAIKVNNLDDIEQMVMQEASQSSYADEDNIKDWAERLTSAFDVVTGEGLPGSTPATNAVLQDRNAKSAFTMVREAIGMFLQRWIDRHALPIIIKTVKVGDIIRIAGSEEKLGDFLDRAIALKASEKLDEFYSQGVVPSREEVLLAMEDTKFELKQRGDVFVELLEDIAINQIDTQIFVTNEELDTAVMVQNLINIMQIVPEMREPLVRRTLDILGIDAPAVSPQIAPQGAPQGAPKAPQLQSQVTQANTLPQNVV